MVTKKNKTVSPARPSSEDRSAEAGGLPKYRIILRDLKHAIDSGTLRPGDKLQTEAELGAVYQASRITVAKAVNELMQQGLVSRRAGSGTYVLAPEEKKGFVFGLLIPDLGRTEIFEPVCQGMMRSPLAKPHSLLWGHAMADGEQQGEDALALCHHYIHQKVSGVFFAPLEFSPSKDIVNRRIAAALDEAGIPMVLLDRCYAPYPSRSQHDLVGIDNRAAGYMITEHLLKLGVQRPAFLSRARSASSVLGRISGFREAVLAYGVTPCEDLVREGDANDPIFVRRLLDELRPDAIVCGNDLTAGRLISTLNSIGVDVPQGMRVTGVDDVKYASLFNISLTTIHQNCFDLGATAMSVMLQRVAQPDLPVRDILLQTCLVVRGSSGAAVSKT
jgi:DNA-binding LacI/PurR family transcriptional regulator